jgi:hypothetical protein
MILRRTMTASLQLSFIEHLSPAVARGSLGGGDPPWNAEHVDRLPAEARRAIGRLCGLLQAAHYFATYSDNSSSARASATRTGLERAMPPKRSINSRLFTLIVLTAGDGGRRSLSH